MRVDLLVFGPHPDDIEIGAGATVAKHVALGHGVGLCDLTRGELGTNGTPEERVREAEAARHVLGAAWRRNLGWPDGGIGDSPDHLREAVDVIRRSRPRTVAIPFGRDRHPDHVAAHDLLTRAVFRSGLARYEAPGAPWRPERTVAYFINDSSRPSFVVDVSAFYDVKRRALACHRSQFEAAAGGSVETRLTSPLFRQLVESRDAQFGALIGTTFAEGFVVTTLLEYPHLLKEADAGGRGPDDRGNSR